MLETSPAPAVTAPAFAMPLEEAMRTQRAIRRLKPDPVDDALVLRLIELALKAPTDRKSTRLNSSHSQISYAVFCLKKKKKISKPDNSARLTCYKRYMQFRTTALSNPAAQFTIKPVLSQSARKV